MRTNKGFTLVEVIISLALLGIIAISLLGAMSSHFTYMTSTKVITQNAFKAQELMENEIDDAKLRMKSVDPSSLEKTKIFNTDLGGIDVKFEELKISHNNKDYYTLVSNVRPDPLDIIKLDSIGIKLMQNTTQIQNDYYGYATDEFNIIGNFSNSNTYKWDHLLNQVEWYISSSKFNIPLPKDKTVALNDDEGHYYPLFPKDYEIYSNDTIYKFGSSESTFPYIKEIAGRHLIFTVTPAAKSGKLGERKESKSVFISGLPVIENLITHLDASYIDFLSNTTEAEKLGTDNMLKLWYDISSIIGRSSPNESAAPSNTGSRPIVKRTDIGDQFIGQYIQFDANKNVQINQGTSGSQVVIFAALRNRSDTKANYIVNGANKLEVEVPEENTNQWNIIRSNITLDSTIIKIGDSKTDIAEIIIFSSSISEENNTKVLDYLSSKYFSNNITIKE